MSAHGFKEVEDPAATVSNAVFILKRQTWNTNRAIVALHLPAKPSSFPEWLWTVRRQVAFRCGFFPVFWGIGIQAVIVCDGVTDSSIDPARYVAKVDNQWAIIQSLFLLDTTVWQYRQARSWGQFVTGKYQDAIAGVIDRFFQRR
jgi:hypothetical protein